MKIQKGMDAAMSIVLGELGRSSIMMFGVCNSKPAVEVLLFVFFFWLHGSMREAAELDPTTDSAQVCGWHRRGLRGLWVRPAPVNITYGEDIAVREMQRT